MKQALVLAAPLLALLALPTPGPAATGSGGADVIPPSVMDMETGRVFEFVNGDLDNTRIAAMQVVAHLRSLPAEELQRVRAAAAELVEICPYTAATVDVFETVRATLSRFSTRSVPLAPGMGPRLCSPELATHLNAQERHLGELLLAVQAHGALLAELKLVPAKRGLSCNSPGFESVKSPMALIAELQTVRERVNALDDETRARIDRASKIADGATARMWRFKPVLMRYKQTLHDVVIEAGTAYVIATDQGADALRGDTAERSRRVRDASIELITLIQAQVALFC